MAFYRHLACFGEVTKRGKVQTAMKCRAQQSYKPNRLGRLRYNVYKDIGTYTMPIKVKSEKKY